MPWEAWLGEGRKGAWAAFADRGSGFSGRLSRNGAPGVDPLEPAASWLRELPQEALPSQPCAQQIREGCNGTKLLLLKKKKKKKRIKQCFENQSWRLEARKIVQGRLMSYGSDEHRVTCQGFLARPFKFIWPLFEVRFLFMTQKF